MKAPIKNNAQAREYVGSVFGDPIIERRGTVVIISWLESERYQMVKDWLEHIETEDGYDLEHHVERWIEMELKHHWVKVEQVYQSDQEILRTVKQIVRIADAFTMAFMAFSMVAGLTEEDKEKSDKETLEWVKREVSRIN